MIIKSIRWRLQLWLGFLLICVLSGFGVAVYQLQRINQLNQIDEELQRRLAALDSAVRGGPPPDFGRGHPPFEPEFRRRTGDVPDSGAVPRARTETPGEERGRANFGIGLRPQAEPEAGSAPPEPGVFPDFEDGPKRGRPPYGRSVFPPPGPGTEMHFRPR